VEKEQKALMDPEDVESEPEPPPCEKKAANCSRSNKKKNQLRENLRNLVKQTQANEIIDRKDREKQFGPITQMLEKVEKAVIQTDEDLSKKLDLMPINKKFESSLPQLTFISDEDEKLSDENIRLIEKGPGVTSKGLGALPRRYIPFQDKIFGIWFDGEKGYFGNKSNEVMIDGNDLIINNELYKGTHGLWKLLPKP